VRIYKGKDILTSKSFMHMVKKFYQRRLERIVRDDPELAKDNLIDNNNIMVILTIGYLFKTFKIVIVILGVSYFIGIFWYIYCDLTLIDDPYCIENENCQTDESVGFVIQYDLIKGMEDMNEEEIAERNMQNAIKVTYWAFTTLSTVGFGDFHPRSNAERALCAVILLFGVTMFSFILGNYI
jgi:hypothetical protein